ncbi:MAG: hypothetical protein WC758_06410 [Candidatus Woesearchaeota archaeon]|jgi:hypothetical protein
MAQTVLDLEQYFERDIIEFLDKQVDLQDSETTQINSEMISILETNNIALAAKLLEDTVADYNKFPLDNVYKELQFKKLLEMLRQAEEFLKINPQQSKLKDYVDLLRNSKQLEQGLIDKITVFEEKLNAIEEAKIKSSEQEREFAKKLREQIRLINENIATSIRKKDLVSAIKQYKELKPYFEQYPSSDLDQKQEFYNDLLSFFMQIGKLKRELTEDKINTLSDRKKLQKSTKLHSDNYLRLEEIKEIITKIKIDVRQSNFASATQRTLELREITSKIPEDYKHIRTILNSKIDIIIQRVEFIKRMKNHNQKEGTQHGI